MKKQKPCPGRPKKCKCTPGGKACLNWQKSGSALCRACKAINSKPILIYPSFSVGPVKGGTGK